MLRWPTFQRKTVRCHSSVMFQGIQWLILWWSDMWEFMNIMKNFLLSNFIVAPVEMSELGIISFTLWSVIQVKQTSNKIPEIQSTMDFFLFLFDYLFKQCKLFLRIKFHSRGQVEQCLMIITDNHSISVIMKLTQVTKERKGIMSIGPACSPNVTLLLKKQ